MNPIRIVRSYIREIHTKTYVFSRSMYEIVSICINVLDTNKLCSTYLHFTVCISFIIINLNLSYILYNLISVFQVCY